MPRERPIAGTERRWRRDLVRHQRRHRDPGAAHRHRVAARRLRPGPGRQPVDLPETPALDGVRCVLVRLLGGRRAWEDGFDALRRACVAADIPFLAFARRGGARRRADRAVDRAERHRHRGLRLPRQRRARELRQPAALRRRHGAARGLRLRRAPAGARRTACGGRPIRALDAKPAGRRRLLPRPPGRREHPVRRPTCATRIVAKRRRRASPCGATRCAATPASPWSSSCATRGRRRAGHHRARRRRHRPRAPASPAAPAASTATTWDAAALAALDVPIIQAPVGRHVPRRWEASDAGLGPYDATAGVAIPEFDGRIIAPAFAFNEVVDDGDELGSSVQAYRTVPDRVGPRRRPRPAPRPPAPHARRPSARSPSCSRLPHQAQPPRQRRRPRHAGVGHRLLDALRDQGYASTRAPPTATRSWPSWPTASPTTPSR